MKGRKRTLLRGRRVLRGSRASFKLSAMGTTRRPLTLKSMDPAYSELFREFPLMPIRTASDYGAAAQIVDRLAVRAEGTLMPGELAYFETLTLLVRDYDDRNFRDSMRKLSPREALEFLMEQRSMRPVDLAEVLGGNRAEASLLINGDRELSKSHIRTLSDYFRVDPGLFLS